MVTPSQEISVAREVVDGGQRRGRWYVLAVLISAYVLAHVDRQALSLLVEPIKRDLHLTDTQISLLQGFSFAVFLTVSGLAFGPLVDSGRRVRIITSGIVAWSVLTASCALASSYVQLLLCRMGVGIGEATLLPAAHSIVADSFPRNRLGLALGIFGIGSYVGAGLALLAGAVVIAHLPQSSYIVVPLIGAFRPWQVVFLALGLPGLLVAVWVGSLREPARRGDGSAVALTEARRYFSANAPGIVLVNLTGAFCAMAVYGANAWVPSYFIRTFGWSTTLAGMLYGTVIIVCGVVGVIGGGALSDLAVSRGLVSGRPVVMALACLCAAPFAAVTPVVSQSGLSVALLVPFTLLTTIALGILPAAQQGIAPSRMRGIVASLGVFMVNLIGLGLGPSLIALMTDYVLHDSAKLRYSLAALLPLMLLAASACGFGSIRHYRASADRLGPH